MEPVKTLSSQSNSEIKNKAGGIILHDFKLYYRAMIIKKVWYLQKNRHRDQWNNIKNTDIKPYIYGQILFDNGAETHNGDKKAFSINGAGRIGKPHEKE